ncbi:hypothetical protein B0H19DRAFT_1058796 [Mycena capillaripes]|nr:hypothetical protein B0H19DRAFT_1058796 [Mycena capillaripes]
MGSPCSNCGFATTLVSEPAPGLLQAAPRLPTSSPLLLTNNLPADSDIPTIESFLAKLNQRVHILKEMISALTAAVDALKRERDTILGDVRSHSAILSPLRYLPPEILCPHILDDYSAPTLDGGTPSTMRWRAISVAFAMLWSFGIDTTANTPSDAFETQFARAGQANLQIAIISLPASRSPSLDTIIAACARWDVLAVKNAAGCFMSETYHRSPSQRTRPTARWRWETGACSFIPHTLVLHPHALVVLPVPGHVIVVDDMSSIQELTVEFIDGQTTGPTKHNPNYGGPAAIAP